MDPSKRGEEIMKKLILLTLSIVSFNNYAVDFVYR
ncbi:pertussis toxin-like subunit ArtA, partial [Salmonella enterica]|nr:pertussis toxin-like subunit ArtA [Salmonella enterica]